MSENIVEVDQDQIAEDRFKRWLEHFRECIYLTDNLKKQELLDSSTSLIESIQSHITKETQSLPSWCNQKAFQKPAKSSGESAKDTKISIFAKNVSTVDDLKLDCRQLSTPHVISDFMAFKELVNTHMQNMTQGSMDASNTAANIASSSQVDVVTNTTGNMSAVDTVLRRYVACINGESNDTVADMCKLMDAQYRLNRSSVRDGNMLDRLMKQERKRSSASQRLLASGEAQLSFLSPDDGNSAGVSASSDDMVISSASVQSGDGNVVQRVLTGITDQYDSQMRGLAQAQEEEERALRAYEAAVQKRSASAALALKTEHAFSALQTQLKHVAKVALARVEVEKYNNSSASARLSMLGSIQRLMAHLSQTYVRTQIGSKAFAIYHSLFMWWRSLCSDEVSGGVQQVGVNLRIGLELVRLCKQLLPVQIANETGVTDELEKFGSDLSTQLSERNLAEAPGGAAMATAGIGSGFGPSFIPAIEGSTSVLYFDHLVHGTPDDHVEAAARTETSIQALRAQALGQQQGAEHSPGTKGITFCCCNDVIAPPIWTLLLVHCPSYLKQLWALNTEAKLNDWLCPLEFDTEWESAESSSSANEGEYSDNDGDDGLNYSRNSGSVREFTVRKGVTDVVKSILSKSSDDVAPAGGSGSSDLAESQLQKFNTVLQVLPHDECFVAARLPSDLSAESGATASSGFAKIKLPEYVSTPYGVGTLIPSSDDSEGGSEESMISVQLPWGRGTFREGCVQYLDAKAGTKVAVAVNGSTNNSSSSSTTGTAVVEERKRSSRLAADGAEERRRRTPSEGSIPAPRPAARKPAPRPSTATNSGNPKIKQAKVVYNLELIKLMTRLSHQLGSQRVLAERLGFKREYLNVWLRQRATPIGTEVVEKAVEKYLAENPADRLGSADSDDSGSAESDNEEAEGEVPAASSSSIVVPPVPANSESTDAAQIQHEVPKPRLSPFSKGVKQVHFNTELIKIFHALCVRNKAQSVVAGFLGVQRSAINVWLNKGHRATSGFINNIQLRAYKYLQRHPEINVDRLVVDPSNIEGAYNEDENGEDDVEDSSVSGKRPREEEVEDGEGRQTKTAKVDDAEVDLRQLLKEYQCVCKMSPTDMCVLLSLVDKSGRSKLGLAEFTSWFEFKHKWTSDAKIVPLAIMYLAQPWCLGKIPQTLPRLKVARDWYHATFNSKNLSPSLHSLTGVNVNFGGPVWEKAVAVKIDVDNAIASAVSATESALTGSSSEKSSKVTTDGPRESSSSGSGVLVALRTSELAASSVCGICVKPSGVASTRRATATGLQCSRCPRFFHTTCLNEQAAKQTPPQPAPLAVVRQGKLFWLCDDCSSAGMKDTVLVVETVAEVVVGATIYFYCVPISTDGDSDSVSDEATLSVADMEQSDSSEDPVDSTPELPSGSWTKATVVKLQNGGIIEARPIPTNGVSCNSNDDASSVSGELVLVNISHGDIYVDAATDSSDSQEGTQSNASANVRSNASAAGAARNSSGGTSSNSRASTRAPGDRKVADDHPTTDSDIDDRRANAVSRYESLSQPRQLKPSPAASGSVGSDTYVGSQSLAAALCCAGAACRAVDLVLTSKTDAGGDGDDAAASGSNAFVCARPPGHHAGRFGCTSGCITSGFCLFNNAAIALVYARVKYGLTRVAVVDIDVHFGNGTADVLKGDPNAFFASVHMVYGNSNNATYYPCCGQVREPHSRASGKGVSANGMEVDVGAVPAQSPSAVRLRRELSTSLASCTESRSHQDSNGFYPAGLGVTEISDNYVCVGVFPSKWRPGRSSGSCVGLPPGVPPLDSSSAPAPTVPGRNFNSSTIAPPGEFCQPAFLAGSVGFRHALAHVILPRLKAFEPELLIISAGFDGYKSDPLGGHYGLSTADFTWATTVLCGAMDDVATTLHGKTVAPGAHVRPQRGRVISLLEGGYDCAPETLGLARCVNAHVKALRGKAPASAAGNGEYIPK